MTSKRVRKLGLKLFGLLNKGRYDGRLMTYIFFQNHLADAVGRFGSGIPEGSYIAMEDYVDVVREYCPLKLEIPLSDTGTRGFFSAMRDTDPKGVIAIGGYWTFDRTFDTETLYFTDATDMMMFRLSYDG